LNANSAGLIWQKTYTSSNYADSLSHTVVLKNTNTGGQVIDVDAIQIVPPPAPQGAGMYDDANANWSYTGSWSTLSTSGPYAGTLHYTSDATATASFPFTGTGFVLSYTKFSNRGNIEVWVDGSLLTTLNANNPSLTWQNTYSSPGYTGPHTVTLRHGGPAGAIIDIDAIQVLP
jgi:hypothetical protein